MRLRPILPAMVATALPYAAFAVGVLVLSILQDEVWQHANALYQGEVGLAWSGVAIVCVAVSIVLLVRARRARVASQVVVGLFNVPVVAVAALALWVAIMGFQDYAASEAAFDTAEQVCGHPPVMAQQGYGGRYLLPDSPDYDRQKYASHIHLIIGGNNLFFCTEADAVAHGFRPLSPS